MTRSRSHRFEEIRISLQSPSKFHQPIAYTGSRLIERSTGSRCFPNTHFATPCHAICGLRRQAIQRIDTSTNRDGSRHKPDDAGRLHAQPSGPTAPGRTDRWSRNRLTDSKRDCRLQSRSLMRLRVLRVDNTTGSSHEMQKPGILEDAGLLH